MNPRPPINDRSIRDTFRSAHDSEAPARNVVQVDYEKYLHFLDDEDLDESQKITLLESLWSILLSFVDLGFGIHPVQQAIEDKKEISVEENSAFPDNDRIPETVQETTTPLSGQFAERT